MLTKFWFARHCFSVCLCLYSRRKLIFRSLGRMIKNVHQSSSKISMEERFSTRVTRSFLHLFFSIRKDQHKCWGHILSKMCFRHIMFSLTDSLNIFHSWLLLWINHKNRRSYSTVGQLYFQKRVANTIFLRLDSSLLYYMDELSSFSF